jgi:hypothetical protein
MSRVFAYADAEEMRTVLQGLVESENRTHGEHTHWIEARENPAVD